MPNEKSAERIKAEQIYKESKGSIMLVEIAERLGVPPAKVRKWKQLDGWDKGTTTTATSKKKQVERTTSRKRNVPPASVPHDSAPCTAPPVDVLISDALEENEELTEQQKDFCLFFMRNRNATQAYLKAYGCTYATANTNGPALLVNTRIKEELRRLREIKNAALGGLCGEDLVELHMRIAFSDITDFVEFESRRMPTMHNGEALNFTNPNTGVSTLLTHMENEIRLRNSNAVDGMIISEVSKGRDGAKIKLADRQKSLAFLERYFDMNPNDRHRKDYDRHRVELDNKKFELQKQKIAGCINLGTLYNGNNCTHDNDKDNDDDDDLEL